jgi:nicotinamide-nucleotide amidase
MDADVVSVLGDRVYGRDEQTLEEIVVDLLTGQKLTLATAESCTGGLISNRITDVSGSSQVFLMGICSYSNEAKISLLSVDRKLIEEHGAVSQEVACAMAEGVRKLSGADLGIAVTGIAGPTGGSDEKPVGLVYLALADGEETLSKRIVLPGDRLNVKLLTSQNALDMIRTRLNSCRT